MKKILSILVFIGIALSVFAEDVVFKAQAPKQVIVGRPFQISYTVNHRCRDLQAPEFTDFDVLSGPYSSTSSSTSFTNGHMTSSYEQTYTYMLMARKAGSFTIGPASVKVSGDRVQSNGVRIEVLPEDQQTTQSQPSSQGRGQGGHRLVCQAMPSSSLFSSVTTHSCSGLLSSSLRQNGH